MTQEAIATIEWKTDEPSEPGYYWVRPLGTKSKSVILVDRSGKLWKFGVKINDSEFAGPFPKPPYP